ncbi:MULTISPECIES: SDR family NAD(P)-dependent oxidoreductase [unclassified Streptomyces]|uniref:SDR family NAD(P)-dependent oxidoreductase n=1 Tax=unclassified Streptomyces TaxID=2593676 RepID=UPI0027418059|nr:MULTISPECIES: SDR family NAD(P)-dependent oxidoreductase [unclassified Streptomyces]
MSTCGTASRVLVVTGAASGLGREIAVQAIAQHWTVALLDRNAPAVTATGGELGVLAVAADVTSPAELATAFATVTERLGPLDGLVNSAGLTRPGPSSTLPETDWRTVVEVDLNGTFYACQAAFPHFAPAAAIVNLASIAAARGLPERTAYSAAKAGVVGLTRSLATEWAPRGLRVNAVGPSWVDTPLIRRMVQEGAIDLKEMTDRVPLGRLGTPRDVAEAVLFLLDRTRAGYITGQTLFVDGGFTFAG